MAAPGAEQFMPGVVPCHPTPHTASGSSQRLNAGKHVDKDGEDPQNHDQVKELPVVPSAAPELPADARAMQLSKVHSLSVNQAHSMTAVTSTSSLAVNHAHSMTAVSSFASRIMSFMGSMNEWNKPPPTSALIKRFHNAIYGDAKFFEEKYHVGWTAQLVMNKYFEAVTLAIISLNALWIGVDMELNEADTWLDAHPVFQAADNGFCIYFSLEVIFRFCAFRVKSSCLKDKSFMFDAALVVLMVAETWIVAVITALSDGGGTGGMRQLRVLRLLRLLRLARMVRLMRAMPELMTLLKGLLNALRSVATSFLFLMLALWVFGIIFLQNYKDHEGELRHYFSRLGISMVTLLVNGTLLDDCAAVALLLMDDSPALMVVFFGFVLLSSLTLFNMLIGVLTKVIKNTAHQEAQNLAVAQVAAVLQKAFNVADVDGDDAISRKEFESLLHDENSPEVQALLSLGIDEDRLRELSRQLFEDEDEELNLEEEMVATGSSSIRLTGRKSQGGAKHRSSGLRHCPSMLASNKWNTKTLNFIEFMEALLALKPGNSVCVRDMTYLGRSASTLAKKVEQECSGMVLQYAEARLQSPAPTGRYDQDASPSVAKLSDVPTEMLMGEVFKRLQQRPS